MFDMAHAPYLREKARELRREKKLTIDELAERLALSRSTIYYWVRDIPIPKTPRQIAADNWRTAAQRAGTRRMQSRYRRLREAAYDEGTRLFPVLESPSFRDFVTLFITEGHKRSRNTVSIANSDPAVIRLAARWIRALSRNPVTFSVQYHADQDLDEIRAFWAEQVGVRPDEIRVQRKSNSNGLAARGWRSRYGVLTITAADTYFRAELQAWVDWMRDVWLDSNRVGA